VIVMFGDSLTEGYGLPRGKSFPDFLQRKLDDQGYRYSVRNEGISGDTTSGGLMRCSLVASSVPAIAVVALGGNDGLRGLSPGRMKDNLRRIIQEFSAQGTQVVIGGMKLPPNYGVKYTDSFERVFHELAQELHVPLIPFLLEGVGGHPEFMQDDGIHPNEEGAHKIATLVMEHLQPLLAKR
jgi:acyl-CoA thioesterase-1